MVYSTPPDEWRLRPAGGPDEPRLRVPGGPLALSCQATAAAAEDGRIDIFTLAPGSVKRSVQVEGRVSELAFDASGDWLGITSQEGGHFRVYRADASMKGEPHKPAPALVDQGAGAAGGLCWSPDGRFLAFRLATASGDQVRFLDLNTSNAADFTDPRGVLCPAWLDAFTAMVLLRGAGATAARLLGVGTPNQVRRIDVTELRKFPGGGGCLEYFQVANGSRFTVCRDGFVGLLKKSGYEAPGWKTTLRPGKPCIETPVVD